MVMIYNSNHLLVIWGGIRLDLKNVGIDIDLTMPKRRPQSRRGKKRGMAYAAQAAAKVTLDMGRIVGVKGPLTYIAISHHGKSASKLFIADQLSMPGKSTELAGTSPSISS